MRRKSAVTLALVAALASMLVVVSVSVAKNETLHVFFKQTSMVFKGPSGANLGNSAQTAPGD